MNHFGGRALHVASISENPEVTRALLQMRSNPDVATNTGCGAGAKVRRPWVAEVLCFSPQYGTNPGHTVHLLQVERVFLKELVLFRLSSRPGQIPI